MNTKYIAIILGLLVLGACNPTSVPPQGSTGGELTTTDELKKFDSSTDIKAFLEKSQGIDSSNSFNKVQSRMLTDTVSAPLMAMEDSGGAEEFSGTNVQVSGVDEADFVKNDGKYIYIINNENLLIMDAYPGEDSKIISETEIKGNPSQIFLNGDRVVVFSQDYDEVFSISQYDFVPRKQNTQITKATVYDVTDRKNPEKLYDFDIRGWYFQSRMIGDNVYFIVNENAWIYNGIVDTPIVRANGKTVVKPDVYYFDVVENSYNYNTIASFDITKDTADINAKSFLLGYSNTLYVTEDNIYIAYQKSRPWAWYRTNNEDRFYEVVLPILPSDVKTQINALVGTTEEKWPKVAQIIENMYQDMSVKEADELIEKIESAIEEHETKQEIDRMKTVVHKIAIDDGDIEYVSRGEIPGYLLNQFSLDEEDGYLRLATTTRLWLRNRGSEVFNNVFVLDSDMEIVGKLEGLAEDEQIYSARFIGDRLYMVTFKRVDPLFVIDLSDPEEPSVLGELKIPGFSDYLHPYGEDMLIGVGKDADDNGRALGVKIALFDVKDVKNPEQIDEYIIGGSGSQSEVSNDHKAFLLWGDTMVIPVQEVSPRSGFEDNYRRDYWQGAYVFDIDDNGFDKRGKIVHSTDTSSWQYRVRRSIVLDDTLYTISDKLIKVNDLESLDDINSIKISNLYDRPMELIKGI